MQRLIVGLILVPCLVLGFGFYWIRGAGAKRDLAGIQAEVRRKYADVRQKSTEELARVLGEAGSRPPVLLDVRSKEEYTISHLKGARWIDTDQNPATALAGLAKDAEVVVYCSVGYRSSEYSRILQQNQYKHVFNLDGSIFKWVNEGRPVFDETHEVKTVHPYNADWGKLLSPQYRAELNAPK